MKTIKEKNSSLNNESVYMPELNNEGFVLTKFLFNAESSRNIHDFTTNNPDLYKKFENKINDIGISCDFDFTIDTFRFKGTVEYLGEPLNNFYVHKIEITRLKEQKKWQI